MASEQCSHEHKQKSMNCTQLIDGSPSQSLEGIICWNVSKWFLWQFLYLGKFGIAYLPECNYITWPTVARVWVSLGFLVFFFKRKKRKAHKEYQDKPIFCNFLLSNSQKNEKQPNAQNLGSFTGKYCKFTCSYNMWLHIFFSKTWCS